MSKVNFTEENLSKIHIGHFEQFLDKYGIEYGKRENDIWLDIGKHDYCSFKFYNTKKTLVWVICDNYLFNSFSVLCGRIYPEYVEGNLTQFHELFTQVYNEIMSYPINEINEKE